MNNHARRERSQLNSSNKKLRKQFPLVRWYVWVSEGGQRDVINKFEIQITKFEKLVTEKSRSEATLSKEY